MSERNKLARRCPRSYEYSILEPYQARAPYPDNAGFFYNQRNTQFKKADLRGPRETRRTSETPHHLLDWQYNNGDTAVHHGTTKPAGLSQPSNRHPTVTMKKQALTRTSRGTSANHRRSGGRRKERQTQRLRRGLRTQILQLDCKNLRVHG